MSVADKKAFYERGDVVADYDRWRFGNAGGRYVNERELDAVVSLLRDVPRDARLLDLPCGTGRLLERLRTAGFTNLVAADYSAEMLRSTEGRLGNTRVSRHDALRTGFRAGAFDAAVSLRFTFHTSELKGILKESARTLRPGGTLVFDTLRWSPRTLAPGLDKKLGGTLFTYSDAVVRDLARTEGFTVEEQRAMLLLPSFAYRLIPGLVVRGVDRVEKSVAPRLLSKCLWRLRRS